MAPSITYAFGTPGAQGRIEVYYDELHRDYTNNRTVTLASDRRNRNVGGAFFWRAMACWVLGWAWRLLIGAPCNARHAAKKSRFLPPA